MGTGCIEYAVIRYKCKCCKGIVHDSCANWVVPIIWSSCISPVASSSWGLQSRSDYSVVQCKYIRRNCLRLYDGPSLSALVCATRLLSDQPLTGSERRLDFARCQPQPLPVLSPEKRRFEPSRRTSRWGSCSTSMSSSSLTEYQGLSCPVQTILEQKETKATKRENRAECVGQTATCLTSISTGTHSAETGVARSIPAIPDANFGKRTSSWTMPEFFVSFVSFCLFCAPSLHCHTLGQVSWLVDITAA